MPGPNPFHSAVPAQNIKLAKLSTAPTMEDLHFAYSQSVSNPRSMIELPWRGTSQTDDFIIKITCGLSVEEPRWILYAGGNDDASVLWNYDTPDIGLIHSLIAAEVDRVSAIKQPPVLSMPPELRRTPAPEPSQAASPFDVPMYQHTVFLRNNQPTNGGDTNGGNGGNGGASAYFNSASGQAQMGLPVAPQGAYAEQFNTGPKPAMGAAQGAQTVPQTDSGNRTPPNVPFNSQARQASQQPNTGQRPGSQPQPFGQQAPLTGQQPPPSGQQAPLTGQQPPPSGQQPPQGGHNTQQLQQGGSHPRFTGAQNAPGAANAPGTYGAANARQTFGPNAANMQNVQGAGNPGGLYADNPHTMEHQNAAAPAQQQTFTTIAKQGGPPWMTPPEMPPPPDPDHSLQSNRQALLDAVFSTALQPWTNGKQPPTASGTHQTLAPAEDSESKPKGNFATTSSSNPTLSSSAKGPPEFELLGPVLTQFATTSQHPPLSSAKEAAAPYTPPDPSQQAPKVEPNFGRSQVRETVQSGNSRGSSNSANQRNSRQNKTTPLDRDAVAKALNDPLSPQVIPWETQGAAQEKQAGSPPAGSNADPQSQFGAPAGLIPSGIGPGAGAAQSALGLQIARIQAANDRAQKQRAKAKPHPKPVDLDRNSVNEVYKLLTDPDTKFLSHGAFLFLLVQEYSRYQESQHPFCVVRFDMRHNRADGAMTAIGKEETRRAGKSIYSVMKSTAWVAHYESSYAFLLPNTTIQEAIRFARDVHSAASNAFTGEPGASVFFSFGIAGVPEDCAHPGVLLAAAAAAEHKSRESGIPIVSYADL